MSEFFTKLMQENPEFADSSTPEYRMAAEVYQQQYRELVELEQLSYETAVQETITTVKQRFALAADYATGQNISPEKENEYVS